MVLSGSQFSGWAHSRSPEHEIPLRWKPDPSSWDDMEAHSRMNEAWDDHADMEHTWVDLDSDERAARTPTVADLRNSIKDLSTKNGFSEEARSIGIRHVLGSINTPDVDVQMPYVVAHERENDVREERRQRLLGHMHKIAASEPYFMEKEGL